MPKVKILYIGNKLKTHIKGNMTTLDALSLLLMHEGYLIFTSSSKRNKFVRLLDMLYSVFKSRNQVQVVLIDTYSTQNFYYAVVVSNLCRLLRVPYIPILHGGNLPERLQKNKFLSYKLFHGAKTNVAPSPYLLEQFKVAGYTNLTHIPNTIDLPSYTFKQRFNLAPKLLWVRAFAEIYNPMLALRVLELLIAKGVKAELCMVGPEKDGSLAKCRRYAEERSLPVSFTGKLEKDLWVKLSEEYDIFINTTNFDNTPVSVIEAMALGLPVVSTNVGGIPYLLDHAKDALLVDANDEEAFYGSIKELLDNNEKVRRLSENARKKVEKFDWQEVKHLWFELLKA